jgi:predicted small lipoprotein YifL
MVRMLDLAMACGRKLPIPAFPPASKGCPVRTRGDIFKPPSTAREMHWHSQIA